LIIKEEEVSSSSTEYVPCHDRSSQPMCPLSSGFCDESVEDHTDVKQRCLLLFVPYQRGDSGVPLALSNLQRSNATISLEVHVTERNKKLLRDGPRSGPA
jgi:hypothetical protein